MGMSKQADKPNDGGKAMTIDQSEIMTEGEIWTVKGLLLGHEFEASYSSWDSYDPEELAREVYGKQGFLINTTLTRQRVIRSWDEVVESKDGPETREQGETSCPEEDTK